jgi:hypothetical protein
MGIPGVEELELSDNIDFIITNDVNAESINIDINGNASGRIAGEYQFIKVNFSDNGILTDLNIEAETVELVNTSGGRAGRYIGRTGNINRDNSTPNIKATNLKLDLADRGEYYIDVGNSLSGKLSYHTSLIYKEEIPKVDLEIEGDAELLSILEHTYLYREFNPRGVNNRTINISRFVRDQRNLLDLNQIDNEAKIVNNNKNSKLTFQDKDSLRDFNGNVTIELSDGSRHKFEVRNGTIIREVTRFQ